MKSRKAAWIIAFTLPLWLAPLCIGASRLIGSKLLGFETASGCLLLSMVLVAAYTDSRYWRIPNWTTYTTALWALAINGYQSLLGTDVTQQLLGAIGIGQCLIGFSALFFGMLVITSFTGGGAGDVKFAGAIGSLLGLANGFEALTISFVGCSIVVLLQWAIKQLNSTQGTKDESGLLGREKPSNNPLKAVTPLAPYFAFGTIVVMMRESGLIEFSIIGE